MICVRWPTWMCWHRGLEGWDLERRRGKRLLARINDTLLFWIFLDRGYRGWHMALRRGGPWA